MSNFGSNQQVITLYEQGMSAEDIYEACKDDSTPLSLEAIKLALYNGSLKYREEAKLKENNGFSDKDLDMSRQVLKNLMFAADSDYVKLRAALIIHDEKTGKRDIKNARNINLSLTLVNNEIKNSEEAIKKAKMKVIDVEDRHKHLKAIEV